MPEPPAISPIRYAILAVLLVVTLAFQGAISFNDLKLVWSQAHNFVPGQLADWAILLTLHFITPLACLALGFYVAAVRIWDPRAWLLLLLLIAFSVTSDGSNRRDEVMDWGTPLKHLALVYRTVVIFAWPLLMLLFAIYFPERASFDRRRPGLKWLLLGPALVSYAVAVWLRIAMNEKMAMGLALQIQSAAGTVRTFFAYGLLAASLALFFVKLTASRDHDDRRRLRTLLVGLGVSFVPALVYEAVIRRALGMSVPNWTLVPVFLLFALFPATLAYVTVVERALDVRVILRESLQYALARRGLTLIQIVDACIVILLITLLSGRIGFTARLCLTAAGIGLIFLTRDVLSRLAVRIDRRFFREAYNAEQVLANLSDSVGSLVELPPLLKTVGARIAEALHIAEVAVFLNEQNSYRLAFSHGFREEPAIAFTPLSPTVAQLHRSGRALRVYADDPRSWVAALSPEERRHLAALNAQLLLPLARREELLGFLSLGVRSAEAPYSPNDVDLLQSVARQTALAIENCRLTTTVANETAEREVIQRELAIAREVQQRLLPQSYPQMSGVACFGVCRPAREVGGDYFDFVELPDAALGIAIGDVSGKGIPASLLMASLQASLRGQTLVEDQNLETLMANVNRLVYAASPVNRYATFFYAHYEPESRRLSYVNAGHNPPLVIPRANGHSVTRLDAGGPPVGLLPQAAYVKGQLELSAGDLLVLFTDGISEAMNTRDEEWGEENLIYAVRRAAGAGPSAIVDQVFHDADAFTAGAPQHDDMTIVLLEVTT